MGRRAQSLHRLGYNLDLVTKLDWETLVERIRKGRCVPFLGAAVNISNAARGYKGASLGAEVSRKLAAKLEQRPRDEENLARVSLYYEVSADRPGLDEALRSAVNADLCQPSPLLRVLARLPFDLIVTTNYDCLMEDALRDQGRDYRTLVQPLDGFAPDAPEIAGLANYKGVIVYKIHGTFGSGESEGSDLIVTEEDYIRFLTTVNARDRDGLPNLIKARLQSRSLLFLGYGLEDWDLRVIYKSLVEQLEARKKFKSYAVQKSPPDAWMIYWERKGVVIHDEDVYRFSEELWDQYSVPVRDASDGEWRAADSHG